MTGDPTNAAERRRWNDSAWVASWPKRERLTSAVTGLLLEQAGLEPGMSVLDIGTGGGVAALAAASLIGEGRVVGADLSEPLSELARRRASEAGADNTSFVVLDLQREEVPGGPFDAAISQFGVMFFDEPVKAFANIRGQLREGGQLSFACWQAPDLNPWFPGSALVGIVPPPPPPAPGKSPANPFTLREIEHTTGILRASGWQDITSSSHEMVVTVARDAIVDGGALEFYGVPEELIAAAGEAIEARLAPLSRPDGRIDAPLAFHIFTAIA